MKRCHPIVLARALHIVSMRGTRFGRNWTTVGPRAKKCVFQAALVVVKNSR